MLQFNNQFRLNLNRIVILYIRCIESSKYYVWKKFDKTCKFKIIYLLLQPLTRKARAFSSVGLEHLPYKQRVGGSNPSTPTLKGSFQSGQMGQTVNLLLLASVVRIHHYPQKSCNHLITTLLFSKLITIKPQTKTSHRWLLCYIRSFYLIQKYSYITIIMLILLCYHF